MSRLSIDTRKQTAGPERVSPSARNGIHDELEFLLREVGIVANHLKKVARRIHDRDQLPAGARSLLESLAQHGPQTVPQLARERSTSRQNIQVLMNRLGSMGQVEFISNPAHKRSDLIRITEQGQKLLSSATQREASFLAPLLSHVSEEEILSSAALLTRLRQLLAGYQMGERKPARTYPKQSLPTKEQTVIAATIHAEPTSPSTAEGLELPVSLL